MTEKASEKASQAAANGGKALFDELPVDRLKDELMRGLSALGERAVQSAGERINGFSNKLNDVAENGGALPGGGVLTKAAGKGAEKAAEGESPVAGAVQGGLSGLKDKVKEKLGGGSGGKGKGSTKATNIVEEIDVGVPVDVAYNQWTQFQDWSDFMKKVDTIEQEADEKVNFRAQVFWSHRRWDATILEQVPNEKIVWRSKGEKGHIDGAVTFHEVAPNLTRILVVLEYYPQGFFEHTGNLWRAQGRRARLELKHFRRHVMTRVLLDPEQLEGWRGEIHDGEVTRSHEEALEDEQQDSGEDRSEEQEQDQGDEGDEGRDEAEQSEDEYDDEEPEDEYDEGEEDEEDEGAEDEYDEDEEPEDEYEDEEEAEPEEQAPARRRRAS